jgi:tetratricopeptide (TPR) repeat protein
MPALHKKWIVMGVSGALIGVMSVFLLRVVSHSEAPASARVAPVAAESPEHELKALAMQLEKKPGHIPVLMRMAQIERDKGDLEEAAGHLREAVKNEPTNQDAHLELGRVLYERKDVDGAMAETEKVLNLNPRQVDALYNMGAIYANLGNAERARTYWAKAVEADPRADSALKAKQGLTKLGGS